MKKIILPFFLVGTLIMIVVMVMTGAPLKTEAAPNGILNLEFAYDSSSVNKIIHSWAGLKDVDGIAAAERNTMFDFIFLFFYSFFLFFYSGYLSKTFGGQFGKAGKWIGRGALLAGGLDILENTGMLISLSGKVSNVVAMFTVCCSVVKWLLALAAVLYVFTGTISLLRTRIMNR